MGDQSDKTKDNKDNTVYYILACIFGIIALVLVIVASRKYEQFEKKFIYLPTVYTVVDGTVINKGIIRGSRYIHVEYMFNGYKYNKYFWDNEKRNIYEYAEEHQQVKLLIQQYDNNKHLSLLITSDKNSNIDLANTPINAVAIRVNSIKDSNATITVDYWVNGVLFDNKTRTVDKTKYKPGDVVPIFVNPNNYEEYIVYEQPDNTLSSGLCIAAMVMFCMSFCVLFLSE